MDERIEILLNTCELIYKNLTERFLKENGDFLENLRGFQNITDELIEIEKDIFEYDESKKEDKTRREIRVLNNMIEFINCYILEMDI